MLIPPLLLPMALILGSAFGAALAWSVLQRRLRRRGVLARLPAAVREGELSSAAERLVTIEGELVGGEISTGFGGRVRTIEDAHVSAVRLAQPEEPRLRVGGTTVWLEGPLQVILGTQEREQGAGPDALSARVVSPGDAVAAEGVLKRVAETASSDGGYRELPFRYTLVPVTDEAWPRRPIALYATRKPLLAPPILAIAAALGVGASGVGWLVQAQQKLADLHAPAAPSASGSSMSGSPASPCESEIARLLDQNDPWLAAEKAKSCGSARAQAEVSWMLGDVDQAAAAFIQAREQDASRPLTMTEVQAVTMVDARRGAGLVRRLKADWYKGPQDPSQSQLDCVASRLDSLADGKPSWSPFCLGASQAQGFYGQTRRSIHHLPAYALHEPDRYVRFQPVGSDDHTHKVGCGSLYRPLERLTDLACRGNLAASRALFAAVVGDVQLRQRELLLVDDLLAELLRVGAEKLPPPAAVRRPDEPLDEAYNPQEQLDELRFDAQKILAVAAAAAWLSRDEARLQRYVPRAEAHARAILEEHLALADGKLHAPAAAHSPSDYSVVDLEMFQAAERDAPEAFVARLRERRYDSPARLQALLATRPRHRAAVGAWVRDGFVPVCRTCGLYALLEASFRRREAARLTGLEALAQSLDQVTRQLGAALVRDPSFGPVISLESLIAR